MDKPDYSVEQVRLNSFTNAWKKQYAQPKDLAAAGYYFTHKPDVVRCYQCNMTIKWWKTPESPMTLHRRWSPRCRFVQSVERRRRRDLPVVDLTGPAASAESAIIDLTSSHASSSSQQADPTASSSSSPQAHPTASSPQADPPTSSSPQASSSAVASGGTKPSTTVVEVEGLTFRRTSQSERKRILEDMNDLKLPDESQKNDQARLESERKKRVRDTLECKLCYDADIAAMLVPCGHVATCMKCASKVAACPICRKKITDRLCAFLA